MNSPRQAARQRAHISNLSVERSKNSNNRSRAGGTRKKPGREMMSTYGPFLVCWAFLLERQRPSEKWAALEWLTCIQKVEEQIIVIQRSCEPGVPWPYQPPADERPSSAYRLHVDSEKQLFDVRMYICLVGKSFVLFFFFFFLKIFVDLNVEIKQRFNKYYDTKLIMSSMTNFNIL